MPACLTVPPVERFFWLSLMSPAATKSLRNLTTAPDPAIETVALVSLGCPKNLVDSEKMMGLLAESGLIPIDDEEEADAVVVNTCGFLEASKAESIEEIQRAAERKKTGSLKRLVVAGCLVQRHRAKLLQWCPQIDAMIGVFDRDRIVQAVRGGGESATPDSLDAGDDLPVYSSIAANATLAKQARRVDAAGYFESDTARLRLTPRHLAYLRMSEGCNQHCTFCTIPSIRGKMRSKPRAAIVEEMRELMQDGAFEINLIGQDTTSYGQDLGDEAGLPGLLEALNAEAENFGGAWLRLMYAYPSKFTDEMIDAIARLPHVVKYIDMPLQHIDDGVLTRMRRHTSRTQIERLLEKLRQRVPGITIRTTFISGFPGETEAEHESLLAFVRDFGFDAMGVFGYSPEPGTPAGRRHAAGQAVPDEVIERRIDELMLAQQEHVFSRHGEWVRRGETFDVLIDGEADVTFEVDPGTGEGGEGESGSGDGLADADSPCAAAGDSSDWADADSGGSSMAWSSRSWRAGRTARQAPQIDGTTYVAAGEPLAPGELVRCRVVDADGYDLIARPERELSRSVALNVL